MHEYRVRPVARPAERPADWPWALLTSAGLALGMLFVACCLLSFLYVALLVVRHFVGVG